MLFTGFPGLVIGKRLYFYALLKKIIVSKLISNQANIMSTEIKKTVSAFLYPAIYVSVLWLIQIAQSLWDIDLRTLGVYPLTLSGLQGIIFSPLIHSGYDHLISNTLPLLVLGTALFYFYRELGLRITLFSWIISGIWVWVFARPSYHIGASGIIYAWAAFLFVSGVIRRHPRLMALSLLVAFLYGSMVWGIFPLREKISWEGHLMGMLSGIILALFYRETGPQRKVYSWELEPEEDDETYDPDNPPYWMKPTASGHGNLTGKPSEPQKDKPSKKDDDQLRVRYHITPGKGKGDKKE
jgi:membrane associated rhomboid family serine protease